MTGVAHPLRAATEKGPFAGRNGRRARTGATPASGSHEAVSRDGFSGPLPGEAVDPCVICNKLKSMILCVSHRG